MFLRLRPAVVVDRAEIRKAAQLLSTPRILQPCFPIRVSAAAEITTKSTTRWLAPSNAPHPIPEREFFFAINAGRLL